MPAHRLDKNDTTAKFSLQMPSSELAEVEQVANSTGTTRQVVIRDAVRNYLDQQSSSAA